MRVSRQEIVDNHARCAERNAVFRRFGYDADRSAAFILSHALPLSGKILEIGTGKGRFLTALLAHVPRVTTVDIDPAEQRCARLNVVFEKPPGRTRFMIADAAHLPWPDHSFDSVVSVNALHHMKNVQRVIDEILRVAKPGGKIVLADFNSRGFAIMNKVHRHEQRIHECFTYRFKELAGRFAVCGWTVILRSGNCQDVLIAVQNSAHEGEVRRKGSRTTR
ncbi:MAG: class I SAM-dependent methyltransferase [Kiritimatiellae bacterium]|nr:class I SAM-dependent methyltransferase [Kiritimatiellia bacterium]